MDCFIEMIKWINISQMFYETYCNSFKQTEHVSQVAINIDGTRIVKILNK